MSEKRLRPVIVAAAFDSKIATRLPPPGHSRPDLLTSGRVLFLLGWIHLKTLEAMLKGRFTHRAQLFELFPTGLGEAFVRPPGWQPPGPASQGRTSAEPAAAAAATSQSSQEPGGRRVGRPRQPPDPSPQAASPGPGTGQKSSPRASGKSESSGSGQKSSSQASGKSDSSGSGQKSSSQASGKSDSSGSGQKSSSQASGKSESSGSGQKSSSQASGKSESSGSGQKSSSRSPSKSGSSGSGQKSSPRASGKSGISGLGHQFSPSRYQHSALVNCVESLIGHARQANEPMEAMAAGSPPHGSPPCQLASPRPSVTARFPDPVQASRSDDPQALRDRATRSGAPVVTSVREAVNDYEARCKRLQEDKTQLADICHYLRTNVVLNPTANRGSHPDLVLAATRTTPGPTTTPLTELAASPSMFYRLGRFEEGQRLAFRYLIKSAEREPEPAVFPDIALRRIYSRRTKSDRTSLESTFFLVVLCWLVECPAFVLPDPIRGQILQERNYSQVVHVTSLAEDEDLQPLRDGDADVYVPMFHPDMLRVFVYPSLRLLPLFLEVTGHKAVNPRLQQTIVHVPHGTVSAKTSSNLDLMTNLLMWQTSLKDSNTAPSE